MKPELPHLVCEGEILEVFSILGEGGSKTVLDVSIGGLKKAIAIPNDTDPQDVQEVKWQRALDEPRHAAFLRSNGLLVNPTYEVHEMLVDGKITEVLAMEPFSELAYQVFDGKNANQTWVNGPLSHLTNYKELLPAIAVTSLDIKKLAELGVSLKSDSISFAFMPDGTMRLFLFDLDGMVILNGKEEELKDFYSRLTVNMLDNIFDYKQHRRFERQGYDFEARQKLATQLVSQPV